MIAKLDATEELEKLIREMAHVEAPDAPARRKVSQREHPVVKAEKKRRKADAQKTARLRALRLARERSDP